MPWPPCASTLRRPLQWNPLQHAVPYQRYELCPFLYVFVAYVKHYQC